MDLLFETEISVWHPLAVHFPVVLLMLAGAAALAWAARDAAFWRGAALWLYALGTLGAAAAYFTGDTMAEQIGPSDAVDLHETLALWTFVGAGVTLALHAALAWALTTEQRASRWGRALHWAAALMGLAVAALVAATGHLGGAMVWGDAH